MFAQTKHQRLARFLAAAALAAATTILAACAPDAPPCNDPMVTKSVLTMVTSAHDAQLKDLQAKTADVATITLESPTVTAYDEKLKIRSCQVSYVVQAAPDKVALANGLIALVTQPIMSVLANTPTLPLARAQRDALQFVIWNNGPTAAEQIRKQVSYKVQKEEGTKDFYATTNVDVTGSAQYLRLLVQAGALAKENADAEAKAAKEASEKQAVIDQLSASGKWRKVVYIMDFAARQGRPDYCSSRGKFCFQGRDNLDTMDTVFYELDASRITPTGAEALTGSYRGRLPVCLVGVQKTDDPRVFVAKGWSTFRNEKGEPVDCLPGAEKQDWDALVAQSKKTEGVVADRTSQPAAAPHGKAPTGSAPANLMALIQKYELCGGEAICLYTSKGNTVTMNVATLEKKDFALLDRSIKGQQGVCLKDVVREDAKNATAEGIAEKC